MNFRGLYSSSTALRNFNAKYEWDAVVDNTYILGNVTLGNPHQDDANSDSEPDLDAQYISSMGRGAITWQWDSGDTGSGDWMLTWADEVLKMNGIRPQVRGEIDTIVAMLTFPPGRCLALAMATLKHTSVMPIKHYATATIGTPWHTYKEWRWDSNSWPF